DQYRDRIAVADGKIAAARSSLHQQSATVLAQIEALNSQLAIVNEQINRCRIINPEHGVVVAKYANQHEFVNIGMPIYRLARTDMMTFRAWFDGRTLSRINLGDMVRINIGSTSDKPQFVEGKITYISPDSEFAPATIKTVDNRSSMVYQVNVEVANDGTLKSGMPGEVFLSK
ncbi:MAG: HlyD family efflux transporter periplasmic adaptor subunit, partial [Bacteroidales bacterium]